MNNENNTCPLAFVDNHDNFREYLFTEDMNNTTLFVGAVDSLVVYDDGGKNGNYSVVVNDAIHINILKLQTYPGSTIHVEVPTLDTDPEYTFFVFGEPDPLGNLDLEDESRLMMYAGQMSDISLCLKCHEFEHLCLEWLAALANLLILFLYNYFVVIKK